jgi:hypothetical protein
MTVLAMNDRLSSATLLITVVTVLYGLWYPDIKRFLNLEIPAYKEQRVRPLREIKGVIRFRAFPLALAALSVTIVFGPDAISLCRRSWNSYTTIGVLDTLRTYNAVGTAFVLVVILSLALAVHFIVDLVKLWFKKRELAAVR